MIALPHALCKASTQSCFKHWNSLFCDTFSCLLLVLQNWDDQAHLSFVQSHLGEILELLVEPGQLSQSGQVLRGCQVCKQVFGKY